MNDGQKIEKDVTKRGITRLCHFTPSRNFGQIVAGKTGVLATQHLSNEERVVYAATDLQRLDGHTGHICCSIEYPNAWYFERARSNEVLFKDWVVLLIDPKYLYDPRTLFCPRNAAAEHGRNVMRGYDGFIRLYSGSVDGAYGRTFSRSAKRIASCPTDEQAEVLVPDVIKWKDVLGIAVHSAEQGANELVRLRLLGTPESEIQNLRIFLIPEFWEKYRLSEMLRGGRAPAEPEFPKM